MQTRNNCIAVVVDVEFVVSDLNQRCCKIREPRDNCASECMGNWTPLTIVMDSSLWPIGNMAISVCNTNPPQSQISASRLTQISIAACSVYHIHRALYEHITGPIGPCLMYRTTQKLCQQKACAGEQKHWTFNLYVEYSNYIDSKTGDIILSIYQNAHWCDVRCSHLQSVFNLDSVELEN